MRRRHIPTPPTPGAPAARGARSGVAPTRADTPSRPCSITRYTIDTNARPSRDVLAPMPPLRPAPRGHAAACAAACAPSRACVSACVHQQRHLEILCRYTRARPLPSPCASAAAGARPLRAPLRAASPSASPRGCCEPEGCSAPRWRTSRRARTRRCRRTAASCCTTRRVRLCRPRLPRAGRPACQPYALK
jgi:hypothetical protein